MANKPVTRKFIHIRLSSAEAIELYSKTKQPVSSLEEIGEVEALEVNDNDLNAGLRHTVDCIINDSRYLEGEIIFAGYANQYHITVF